VYEAFNPTTGTMTVPVMGSTIVSFLVLLGECIPHAEFLVERSRKFMEHLHRLNSSLAMPHHHGPQPFLLIIPSKGTRHLLAAFITAE
jgi:hypothetical protein